MKTTIDMAREAGDGFDLGEPHGDMVKVLKAFEALVRADEREIEREACAKVCEQLLERPCGYSGTWEGYGNFKTQMTGQECASAIRARGNT